MSTQQSPNPGFSCKFEGLAALPKHSRETTFQDVPKHPKTQKRRENISEKTATNLQKYIRSTPLAGTGKEGFDPYQGTFLSEKAADFKQGRLGAANDLDSVIRAAKKAGSIGNVLGAGATSGLMAYGLSSAMQGADLGKVGDMSGDILAGGGTFNIGDIVGEIGKGTGGPLAQFGKLFKGDDLLKMLFQGGKGAGQGSSAAFQYLLQTLGALQDY